MYIRSGRSSKLTDTSDKTLICMFDFSGDVHAHTFGESWGREMAEIRPEEIWFFADLVMN